MQRFAPLLAVAIAMTLLGLSWVGAQSARPSMRDRANATDVGIWKSYAPKGLKGEFNNYDPIGLIAGDLIHADCSINWVDPDNRKIYCFSTATSMNYFRDWPKSYARRAAEAYARMRKSALGS